MTKVFHSSSSSIESIELVNQILPHVIQLPHDFNDKSPLVIKNEDYISLLKKKHWSSITVRKGLFTEVIGTLNLIRYQNVQFIHIQQNSFKKIYCLNISNLRELRALVVDNGSFSLIGNVEFAGIF